MKTSPEADSSSPAGREGVEGLLDALLTAVDENAVDRYRADQWPYEATDRAWYESFDKVVAARDAYLAALARTASTALGGEPDTVVDDEWESPAGKNRPCIFRAGCRRWQKCSREERCCGLDSAAPTPPTPATTPAVANDLRPGLEEALRPFLDEHRRLEPLGRDASIGDSCQLWQCGPVEFARTRLTYGDLRRLAALTDAPGADASPAPSVRLRALDDAQAAVNAVVVELDRRIEVADCDQDPEAFGWLNIANQAACSCLAALGPLRGAAAREAKASSPADVEARIRELEGERRAADKREAMLYEIVNAHEPLKSAHEAMLRATTAEALLASAASALGCAPEEVPARVAHLVKVEDRHARFVDAVVLWTHREKVDDATRVSALKHHPTVAARIKEAEQRLAPAQPAGPAATEADDAV